VTIVCALCPNFVALACQVPLLVADSLFVFVQDNKFRIALDSGGRMTRFYEEMTSQLDDDARGHVAFWIRMLAKTAFRSVEYIRYNSRTNDYRKFSLGLARAIRGDAYYIVWTRQDYTERHLSLVAAEILDRDAALSLFRSGLYNKGTQEEESGMIDLVTAGTAIKVAADAIGLMDKISKAYGAFRSQGTVITAEKSAEAELKESVTANNTGTALVHHINGHESQTITREELSKRLDENDLEYIQVYETKMSQLFKQWAFISKQYENAGVGEQAKLKGQLEDTSVKMKTCLNAIVNFVEKLGFELGDHYAAIKAVTEDN
jgi:hypothetical protein